MSAPSNIVSPDNGSPNIGRRLPNRTLVALALAATSPVLATPAFGGAYAASGSGITYPSDYAGNDSGTLEVEVCLAPSMASADVARAERPIRNAMARWSKGEPTTANVRDGFLENGIDFESVALHELGHCLGLAHPNLGSPIKGAAVNSTQSTTGPDGTLALDPGADGVYGSADDERGDDVNRYYFRRDVNDPYSMPEIVDASTYTNDLAALPVGDLFPVNAERRVGDLLGVPFTEATMQHDLFFEAISRTPSHDDVSAIRLGQSGFDGRQGTADDYDLNLVWGGVSDAASCDITIEFAADAGLARCTTVSTANGQPGGSTILDAKIEFAPAEEIDWYFNRQPPCTASDRLVANEWRQVSLPCEVGVSASASVRTVFGDDLDPDAYDRSWVLFVQEYSRAADGTFEGDYRKLALDDALASGAGYWMISRSDATIDVSGEYHAQLDTPVFVDAGGAGWNMVGNPFRYATGWANARVVDVDGRLLDLAAADPGTNTASETACTGPGGPTAECTVARFAYRYDGAAGVYDVLSPRAGSLGPFDAVWVSAFAKDVELRIAMPGAERTTR